MHRHLAVFLCGVFVLASARAETRLPGPEWQSRAPAEAGLDAGLLDALADRLGGRGCVIKEGCIVKEWGDQAQIGDWYSSAKPVLSTLLFFAIEEGLVKSVDQPIADFGWDLEPRHQGITFRHLGAMTSGYARPEGAGKAWAYNDFAIQLYQKTLFEKVFKQHGNEAASQRLGALGFQDGLRFTDKNRLKASVRDFARIAWFWTQKGRWNGRQVLPERYFNEYMRPQTPKDIPLTQQTGNDDDYLAIGSYGGSSDHFSSAGPGIYGFNWWFNATGRLHPEAMTWPDAPPDTVMSIGARGNSAAFIPSLNTALICAEGNWGEVEGGNPDARLNQVLGLFARAAGCVPLDPDAPSHAKWSPVTLDFRGPGAHAADSDPNPFLDYRMQVRFTGPGGIEYDVPGFFAGDGNGGLEGATWRVLFSPDAVGEWRYRVAFRKGAGLAISLDPHAGEAAAPDGKTGGFTVRPQPETAKGFYRWGRLEYVGRHHLKLRDGGFWLKGGTDSPEDFLAYKGFANTPHAGHAYQAHETDWRPGDPDWDHGRGKGIVGALNYLASMNVNSIYFLVMNIGGDGKNVYPYLGPIEPRGSASNDNLHFDLAKLHQWGLVFDHAQRNSIMLHVVLNEAEEANKQELDGGALGVERKLYYRELVARFAHCPALQWNLCEEYNIKHPLLPELVKDFAQYLQDVDPYDHPITVHHAGNVDNAWAPFLGDPRFTVTSFQTRDITVVEQWREKSRAAGFPLVIGMDEFFPDTSRADNLDRHRREYLWPIYFSGGQLEFILDDLLRTDDFRKYEPLWRDMAHARQFIQQHLPFWEMEPAGELLTGAATFQGEHNRIPGQVFARPGQCYAVYLPVAEPTGALDLTGATGEFIRRWYDPRTGAFTGDQETITGGRPLPLGPPPEKPAEDWVVLITRPAPPGSPP
ncbi:MAG TPA: DUF5060 domain-containing protein [Candidatus Hydrogenedentes bacterium]|nr:DUF5060 domain-containing protein [Candidatus Hydrogenedentota bacterium]